MRIEGSRHFQTIDVSGAYNVDRANLGTESHSSSVDWSLTAFGAQVFRGIPFLLGEAGKPNVVRLTSGGPTVRVPITPIRANWLVFLHVVDDRAPDPPLDTGPVGPAPQAGRPEGNRLGDHVSSYGLIFEDGTKVVAPVFRRFAIQQPHVAWSASPFAAIPARQAYVHTTASEDMALGRRAAATAGRSQTRHYSGRVDLEENLWLYALANPRPDASIASLQLEGRDENSLVYGISGTQLVDHPLRPAVRRRILVTLPPGITFNALGEIDCDARDPRIAADLGTVISARAALSYPANSWRSDSIDPQPIRSTTEAVVDLSVHPAARLYMEADDGSVVSTDIDRPGGKTSAISFRELGAPDRPVRFKIVERGSRTPVPVRFHVHAEAGDYLPPRGYHRKVNSFWYEDNAGELVNGLNQYAYVPGECIVDVPRGRIHVEVSRGFEVSPLRTTLEISDTTDEIVLELDRVLRWRERGWVTADTHVHFLTPQTALLEGQAEGVNVVNLLAAQWGEMFSNVADFDGKSTFGARDFGGDGEFLVRVGTENRMQVLGHISLLGYSGQMIHPLSTGGPSESAIGDPLEVSMANWAERCLTQGGLVVMPHAPNPQAERAADIVMGCVDAIEMMTFNPRDAQVNPYGLADWYRYLNIGYQLPLVAGSDKMSAASILGGIRTYAQLADQALSYGAWMAAVRRGNTFVTIGPLVEMMVEGEPPGSVVRLPRAGGRVSVSWRVESVNIPIAGVELVAGGRTVDVTTPLDPFCAAGTFQLLLEESTWVALRLRGSLCQRPGDIAAHTSAVSLLVGDQPIFIADDAVAVLAQIEGALAYVDTLAPPADSHSLRSVRLALQSAHVRLHDRLHKSGKAHAHAPLYGIERPHSH